MINWCLVRRKRETSIPLIGALVLCALATLPGSGATPIAHAQAVAAGACIGHLRAAPSTVRFGAHLALRGTGFTCKSSRGRALKTVPIFFYQPNRAFYIFDVRVQHNGSYHANVVIPQQLIAAASLFVAHQKRVNTKPGVYYLGIQVHALAIPPVSQASAVIHVER